MKTVWQAAIETSFWDDDTPSAPRQRVERFQSYDEETFVPLPEQYRVAGAKGNHKDSAFLRQLNDRLPSDAASYERRREAVLAIVRAYPDSSGARICRLAQEGGIASIKTVYRILLRLAEEGVLERRRGTKGHASLYRNVFWRIR